MNTDYKTILITKFEAFDLEDNSERKKLLKFEVFNILKEIEKPDSDDLHIWGLTYYMSDNDKDYNRAQALNKFLDAFELDPDNFLACLYIAHCFHDQGDLENALKYYEKVDKDKLKKFRLWRYVKLIEQIGFCYHKLGNQSLGRKYFEEVVDWYQKLSFDEVAVPTEMKQCLPESDELIIKIEKLENS